METSILRRSGIHENDIKVYEALLGLGVSKTGAIIGASGVGSSQTYLSLTRLTKRGLVSYQVRNNVRYYRAELPDTLIEESRKGVAELEALSKELAARPKMRESRNFVNTFETKDGFKKALLRHVDLVEPKEVLCIIGFSSKVSNLRELRSFLARCNALAEAKRCTMRMILDEKFRNSLGERMGKQYTVRYMPPAYFTPSALNICSREVVLSVWGPHPIAISITEPAVIQSFQLNFESLWEIAKK